LTELRKIARIDSESLERASSLFGTGCGHSGMHCTHVNVDGIEQQRGAVWVGIEPAFEGDLFEMFGLTGAWFKLRVVHVLDVSLLPVVRFGTNRRDIKTMGCFHV